MFGKIIVVATLAAILYNLGAGLYFMMVEDGATGRTVGALTRRIGLSVALILFVFYRRQLKHAWGEAGAD